MPKDVDSKAARSNSRLQFSVRNLLIASTLFAVWLSCGVTLFKHDLETERVLEGLPEPLAILLFIALYFGVVSLPFVAVGSLFGRGRLGIVIGIAATLASLLFLPRIE